MKKNAFALALATTLLTMTMGAQAQAPFKPGPTLAFGGDVMFDAPTRRAVTRVAADLGEAEAYRLIFSEVAPALRAADVAFVNLETPVSPRYRRRPEGSPAVFWASRSLLSTLRDAGVDVVSIANNHAYDQGARGLLDTIEAVANEGLLSVGAGADAQAAAAPRIISSLGIDIAFAAWSQGMNRGLPAGERGQVQMAMVRDDTIRASLSEAQARAPLVVASLHWARETGFRLGREELEIAQVAADAGADLIVGHGMHVPDRSRWLDAADGRRVLLISALGNLSGLMRAERGAVYRPPASVRDAPIVVVQTAWSSSGRLQPTTVTVVPCWISPPVPNAAWWPESGQPLARPVSILAEIERLREAQCGADCERRIRAYTLRAAIQTRLLVPQIGESDDPERGISALARLAVPGWPGAAAPQPPSAVAAPVLRPHPFLSEVQQAIYMPSAAIAHPAPHIPPSPPRSEARRPSAAAYFRGAPFPSSYSAGVAAPDELDQVALDQLTQLMRRDPRLRVQITGYRANSERGLASADLAEDRARDLEQRLLRRGISARRVQTRAGRSQGRRPGEAHLVIRLWPPSG